MTEKKFKTAYDPPFEQGVLFTEPSMALQSEAESADVNNIIKKYEQTGVIDHVRTVSNYSEVDITDIDFEDYHSAMNIMIDSKERFDAMPSRLRERFDNDPAKLIHFLSQEFNRAEAEALGLVPPAVKEEANKSTEPQAQKL